MLLKPYKLVRQTIREFVAEDPFTLAGALSYYTLLSLAPLLLVVVAVAGIIFGEEAARGEVLAKLEQAIGTQAAGLAQDLLANAHERGSGWLSATVGGVGVVIGATTGVGSVGSVIAGSGGVVSELVFEQPAASIRPSERARREDLEVCMADVLAPVVGPRHAQTPARSGRGRGEHGPRRAFGPQQGL